MSQDRTPKLHEILAVEGDQEGRAKKLIEETTATFKNKERLFQSKSRTLAMFNKEESNRIELEAMEAKESVSSPLSSTIPEALNYLGVILADYYDVLHQKEATNQTAKADIVIGNETIVTDAPVTFLLSMESRLKEVRKIFEEIPTLEPTVAWTPDETHSKQHVWRSPEKKDTKTSKEVGHRIVAPATNTHPAQVYQYDTVKNIGQYTDVEWSGKITSADKAAILERIDAMIQAVKKARQRANTATLIGGNVADKIFGYILGNWFDRSRANSTATV